VIEKRVGERLENGAIDEVKNILKMGYKSTDPGLKTIGYQQIIKYLNKELTKEKAIEDWINKEVQYAKRQLTFMKKDHNIKWREI
jgi:tRNA dimethylallyltransferase